MSRIKINLLFHLCRYVCMYYVRGCIIKSHRHHCHLHLCSLNIFHVICRLVIILSFHTLTPSSSFSCVRVLFELWVAQAWSQRRTTHTHEHTHYDVFIPKDEESSSRYCMLFFSLLFCFFFGLRKQTH